MGLLKDYQSNAPGCRTLNLSAITSRGRERDPAWNMIASSFESKPMGLSCPVPYKPKKLAIYLNAVKTMMPASIHFMALAGTNF